MSVGELLGVLALQPLVQGAGAANQQARLAAFVQRYGAHFPKLLKALGRASEEAWAALEVILLGDGLWERFATTGADLQPIRDKLRIFLEAAAIPELAGKTQFRKRCVRELGTARERGVLAVGDLDLRQLASEAAALGPTGEQSASPPPEVATMKAIAEELRQAGYGNLAWVLALQTSPPPHILIGGLRFFWRRELEADRDLLPGTAPPPGLSLGAAREAAFAALADALAARGQPLAELLAGMSEKKTTMSETLNIKTGLQQQPAPIQQLGQDVLKLLSAHQLDERELRVTDCLSLSSEGERQQIESVVARCRALSDGQRWQLPGLLNAVGKLQMVAGEFEGALHSFQEAAASISDPAAQAEVYYNAYHAALERSDWSAALLAFKQATALAPERFAAFPLDKYVPERILGAGGFGVVFLCRNRHSGSRVVVKALRVDGLERDVSEVFREARVVEELDHPAIIRLRDCDYADAARKRPYLVMDYFDGLTLASYVEKHGPLSPTDLLAIAVPTAEALQTAHARGLLHRDVKPANLLVRRENGDWSVKLIDFGLALTQRVVHTTVSSPAMRSRTIVGRSLAGTLDYSSPEQMGRVSGVDIGPYSDVYGFGRTCYFALLGTPEPDDEEKDQLPAPWRKLLSQCTARTVAKRLPDFKAVLERLADVEAELSGRKPTAASPSAAEEEENADTGETDDLARRIAECSQAIQRNPRDVDAYYNRGVAYATRGEHEKAIADYTQVLKLDPRDACAYANRGNSYRMLGAPDRAIADYNAALKIDPRFARAYIYRGGAYEEMGEYEQAIENYIEAIQLDDKNPDAYNALTWLWSTCPDPNVRDGPRAVEYATGACELTGWNDPNVLDTLAAAYAECGEFEDAVRWQKKALALAPPDRRAEFQFRVKLYMAGTPYREKAGAGKE